MHIRLTQGGSWKWRKDGELCKKWRSGWYVCIEGRNDSERSFMGPAPDKVYLLKKEEARSQTKGFRGYREKDERRAHRNSIAEGEILRQWVQPSSQSQNIALQKVLSKHNHAGYI
jgi:hypothetical protein